MSKTQTVQQLEESLSALVDGEASELEIHRLLKVDSQQYEELRNRWLRYQTISASIKDDVPNVDYGHIASSISAAIDEESTHSASTSTEAVKPKAISKIGAWSGVGRFAIAASVAGAVVLGVQFIPGGADQQIAHSPEEVKPFSAAPSSGFLPGLSSNTEVSTVSTVSADSAVSDKALITITESTREQLSTAEEQVNRLMLEHAQNSAQNTPQGVLPYARVPESE